MTPSKYLSVKEVSSILKIDKKTVYKLIYAGEVPGHFKLGSLHFVDEEVFRNGLKSLATQKKQTVPFHQTRKIVEDKHGLMK